MCYRNSLAVLTTLSLAAFSFSIASGQSTSGKSRISASDAQVTDKVFLDIKIGEDSVGRIVIGLFGEDVPITTKNFYELVTGESGGKASTGQDLHFENSIFHRVIPGFLIQGGDFTHGNGTGGESIYGKKFADENFNIAHDSDGVLSMVNGGRNTNTSQFMIALAATPHLDGRQVVFGRVLDGMNVVRLIEAEGTQNGTPKNKVVIAKSGAITTNSIASGKISKGTLDAIASNAESMSTFNITFDDWEVYKSVKDKFRIKFPGVPRISYGGEGISRTIMWEDKEKTKCALSLTVGPVVDPKDWDQNKVDEVLEAGASAFLLGIKSKRTVRNSTAHNGMKGIELAGSGVTLTGFNCKFRTRILLDVDNSRFFIIGAVGNSRTIQKTKMIESFLNSLALFD